MKVLVKDDYSIFRIGICALINENLNEIDLVDSDGTTDFFEQVVSTECDLVIINFRAQPHEACAELHLFRQSFPQLPVIVIDFDKVKAEACKNDTGTFFLDGGCSFDQLAASIEKAVGRNISYR